MMARLIDAMTQPAEPAPDPRRVPAIAMLDLYAMLSNQANNPYLYEEERIRTQRRLNDLREQILELMGVE